MFRIPGQSAPPHNQPIITLTTDFGLTDSYVAALKAVLLAADRRAILIDITHDIPPHDVLAGSIALERALAAFPPRTVHLAVIDPGVGSARRLLLAELKKSLIVCPDNGLLTWPLARHRGESNGKIHELTWRPAQFSDTFHGRDILAPVAAMLAAGRRIASRSISDPILLDVAPATGSPGRIIHIDHFGNATTNIPGELARARSVLVRRRNLGSPKRTYSDAPVGKSMALIGSSDLLEIAVRNGSAQRKLHLRVGDPITLI